MFKIQVQTTDGWTSYLGPDKSDECYTPKTRNEAWKIVLKWLNSLAPEKRSRIEEVSIENWG